MFFKFSNLSPFYKLEKRKFDAENVKSTKKSREVITSEIACEVLYQHASGMKVTLLSWSVGIFMSRNEIPNYNIWVRVM